MDMLRDIVILLIGFVLLIKGADYFVEGSSSVAKLLKVPSIVVGLTIVAMGTSLPEMSVSVSAALNGSNEIAVSNVAGSNIFNLIVVLGACALIKAVPVDKAILKRDFPFSIIISVILAFMFADFIKPWGAYEGEGVGRNCADNHSRNYPYNGCPPLCEEVHTLRADVHQQPQRKREEAEGAGPCQLFRNGKAGQLRCASGTYMRIAGLRVYRSEA